MTGERETTIPIIIPLTGEEEVRAARRPILSGWLTQGPEVAAFEAEFAEFVGSPFACAVSSCTSALHLALLATGVGRGDEVVTVSHTNVSTANVIRYCGAEPVFVDIQPGTFNVDPEGLEKAITKKTRAILAVHQMGMPCDLDAVAAVASARKLPLVEDAACCSGSEVRIGDCWERIGRPHGTIACFSFHPRKVITTGDGGMITTADEQLDERFRLLRQHGMSVPASVRHVAREVVFEAYPVVGYNYRMTDIQAAIGREQLKRLPEIVRRRRALAQRYKELLAEIAGVGLPEEPSWARSNWQSFAVRLPLGSDQRRVMQYMLDRGVSTRRGIMCIHREPAYADLDLRWPLPESEAAQEGAIILPLFPQMTEAEQDRVVETLRDACAAA